MGNWVTVNYHKLPTWVIYSFQCRYGEMKQDQITRIRSWNCTASLERWQCANKGKMGLNGFLALLNSNLRNSNLFYLWKQPLWNRWFNSLEKGAKISMSRSSKSQSMTELKLKTGSLPFSFLHILLHTPAAMKYSEVSPQVLELDNPSSSPSFSTCRLCGFGQSISHL